MNFKHFDFLPENWLNALGTMLFHSLWMGVMLAIIAGAIMVVARKASAKLRYNWLTGCLLLFIFAISLTFYLELSHQAANTDAKQTIEVAIHLANSRQSQFIAAIQFDLFGNLNKVLSIWNSYGYQIVLLWFLIICGKSVQLLVGLSSIYRLRNNQTYAAGKTWDEHLDLLSRKLGLNQEVKMLQSGIVKVPLVVGHLKPLILIPLGLLNGLSTVEVEAILAHELAHVKRGDYLVNLLQSAIEIVFFFNPAVLWVSHLIKTEREHCCDDLAIACVNDRKNYVKALIFCQEFKQRAPAYAMGIDGNNGSLLHRASRMLFNTNSTLNKMEKTILTIALVSTVIFTAAFKNVGKAASISRTTISNSILAVQDTAKKNKSAEQLEKEIEQKIKAAEKKATEKNKPAKKSSGKQDQTDYEEIAQQAKRDASQAVIDAKQAVIDAEVAKKDAEVAKKDAAQAVIDARVAEEDSKQAIIDAQQAAKDSRDFQQPAKMGSVPRTPKPPKTPRINNAPVPTAPPAPPLPRLNVTPPATPPAPPKANGHSTVSEGNTVSVHVENGKDNSNKIITQLLNDGLIPNIKNFSFSLDKINLIVNGVKQSKGLHTKYRSKYLEGNSHLLSYVVNVTKTTKK
jgi:bla regulator protein BlaR1